MRARRRHEKPGLQSLFFGGNAQEIEKLSFPLFLDRPDKTALRQDTLTATKKKTMGAGQILLYGLFLQVGILTTLFVDRP